MKLITCRVVVLMGMIIMLAMQVSAEPKTGKGRRAGAAQENDDDDAEIELRQLDVPNDNSRNGTKADPSSGRLFMKKFLLFRNIFSNNQQQPVIIVTGNGGVTSPTGVTSPSTPATYTSSGTIPSASGTISISPTTSPQRVRSGSDGYNNNEQEDDEEAAVAGDEPTDIVDEQALQAALVAGAQEYVVTDEDVTGTADSKATKQPGRINLRRKGSKNGQTINVRVPPKYRNYFKNGQKVMLSTGLRKYNKRRVVKKRGGNKNGVRRRRVNKNRRNRFPAAGK